jgi:hypothetical protein
MHRASLVAGAAALALAMGCGSRSELLGLGASSAGGAGAAAGGAPATGGGGAMIDAGPDAPPPPPPCALVAAGAAIDVVAFPDRHATAPSAVGFGPSSVALQTFASAGSSSIHDDIELVGFSMGEPWPSGLVKTAMPALFGIESHGWANLVLSPDQAALALTWHGDPGGKGRPLFRLWDIASWSPGPPVDIAGDGEAVLDTAAGAGVGSLGVGYGGQGYGVVFREVSSSGGASPTRPVAAVLDAQGQRVLGPHPVAAPADYPGRAPAMAWTGAAYLMATSFTTCPPGDALCVPLSVVITRIRPASGDAFDDSGVDFVTAMAAQASSVVVGRPALAHHGGRTHVAWAEGDQSDVGSPRRVLVAELSKVGEVVSGPAIIDEAAPMQSRLTLLASDLGVSATWVEDGDATLPDGAVGRSRVVTTHLSPDLEALSLRVTVPTTRWDPYGAPKATALAEPRSLLVVWSGRRTESPGLEDVWATRLDCAK